MATVNLLNSSWQTSQTNGNVDITTSSDGVKFRIGTSQSTKTGWAKACISIDASKYSRITLKYSKITTDGITDLYFGVYNSINAGSSDTATDSLKKSSFDKTDGGTINFDIPSSVSGTKYVGFHFYGNSNNTSSGSSEHVYITSLTATERSYTLTYNANGGSGAPSAVSDITSTTISSTVPTRSGYDFLGWSTSSSATYATYFAGNTISLSSDTTLYAVWRKFYTVTYDANGGSNAPSPEKKIDGETITIGTVLPTPPANTSIIYTITFNVNGGTCDPNIISITNVVSYDFVDWNTKADGSGISYQFADLYSENSDITLYAQYNSTITYNSTTLPTPSRRGHDFLGWGINEEDTIGITGEYTPTESETTLYATWKRRGLVYICDNAGEFSAYEVFIYDGSGWNLYIPYIYTESGWIEYSG